MLLLRKFQYFRRERLTEKGVWTLLMPFRNFVFIFLKKTLRYKSDSRPFSLLVLKKEILAVGIYSYTNQAYYLPTYLQHYTTQNCRPDLKPKLYSLLLLVNLNIKPKYQKNLAPKSILQSSTYHCFDETFLNVRTKQVPLEGRIHLAASLTDL